MLKTLKITLTILRTKKVKKQTLIKLKDEINNVN